MNRDADSDFVAPEVACLATSQVTLAFLAFLLEVLLFCVLLSLLLIAIFILSPQDCMKFNCTRLF